MDFAVRSLNGGALYALWRLKMKTKEIISKDTYEEYKAIISERKALMKKVNMVLGCIFAISFILAIVLINGDPAIPWGFIAVGVVFLALIISNIVIIAPVSKKMQKVEDYENARQKEKDNIEAQLRKQQEATAQDALLKLDDIKKTVIVETHTSKDNDSATNRAVVGALLFGATGAIVGATSAHDKSFTTFLIIYNDDSRTTQTVENGSTLYNHYIKFLDV